MSNRKKLNRVNHSRNLLSSPLNDRAAYEAAANAVENLAGGGRIVSPLVIELGSRVASLAVSDRSQRSAHHIRYRQMLGITEADEASMSTGSYAEDSLLDFHRRITLGKAETSGSVLAEHGKGISAELGHVDQLGRWEAAHPLDEEIRRLPESVSLREAGFVFNDTYGDKDVAKISYAFRLRDNEIGSGVSLMGVRKRAAADIETTDGARYEIIKRSSFLVDALRLDTDNLQFLDAAMASLQDDKDMDDDEKAAIKTSAIEAGKQIIEPYITDKEKRKRSKAVLAVSSLYFALRRY